MPELVRRWIDLRVAFIGREYRAQYLPYSRPASRGWRSSLPFTSPSTWLSARQSGAIALCAATGNGPSHALTHEASAPAHHGSITKQICTICPASERSSASKRPGSTLVTQRRQVPRRRRQVAVAPTCGVAPYAGWAVPLAPNRQSEKACAHTAVKTCACRRA